MKIIKRKFNIKPFVNEFVVKELEKRDIWDLYEKNLLNYIEEYKNKNIELFFPFIIDSFIWSETKEGSNLWIDLSGDIDPRTRPELHHISKILELIKYEN